jgi:Tol biopolymer transport system component
VGFTSRATNLTSIRATWNVFAHNRRTRKTALVSRNGRGRPANGSSYEPSLSETGRFAAFYSSADNLGGDPAYLNVFLRDRRHGRTRLASRTSDGTPADGDSYQPSISATGRFVTFSSDANNLGGDPADWDVFVWDRRLGGTALVSQTSDGTPGDDISWRPAISGDGLFVAFESYAPNLGAEAGHSHLFVRGPLG